MLRRSIEPTSHTVFHHEIIVGIIGVETRWGRVMVRRACWMRLLPSPLIILVALVFTRQTFDGGDEHADPHELRGSFAGAMDIASLCHRLINLMRLISTMMVIICGIRKML